MHTGSTSPIPTLTTLTPTVSTPSGGIFNGQIAYFTDGHSLEVYYKYAEGTTVPDATAQLSTKQTITAVFAGNTIPGFQIAGVCKDFAYKVSGKGYE